jgi:3-oxoacyl-[acyl-carrier-protein] synthase-1
MQRALQDAGLDPASIDHVNAHGTGTPVGDAAEARAIAEVFGEGQSVSSIKGAVGHTIAAAGAVEAIACAVALQEGFVPGTSGCEDVEEWPVCVERQPRFSKPRRMLSNSMGFGGQNCSLIWGRIEG